MRRICPGVMFRTYLTMHDTVASACGCFALLRDPTLTPSKSDLCPRRYLCFKQSGTSELATSLML